MDIRKRIAKEIDDYIEEKANRHFLQALSQSRTMRELEAYEIDEPTEYWKYGDELEVSAGKEVKKLFMARVDAIADIVRNEKRN